MQPRILLLATMLALGAGSGCEGPLSQQLFQSGVEEVFEVEDEKSKTPSDIIIIGMFILTEPCEFSISLVSSDEDGHIADFRQTGGDLPPGYVMNIEDSDPSTPGVIARISGPPVNAGSWTAYFVAVDNEGHESPAKDVPLICGEKT